MVFVASGCLPTCLVLSEFNRPRERNPTPNHGIQNIHHSLEPTPHVKQGSNRRVARQGNISSITTCFPNLMTTKPHNPKRSTTPAKNKTPTRKGSTTKPMSISKCSLSSPRPDKSCTRNITSTKGLIQLQSILTRHKTGDAHHKPPRPFEPRLIWNPHSCQQQATKKQAKGEHVAQADEPDKPTFNSETES